MNKTEKEGVEAIVFLQKMAGIDEAEDLALINWRNLTDSERSKTLEIYDMVKD